MTKIGKYIVAIALIAVGVAMLGFTACGMFVGTAFLFHNGWQVAWIGFLCAIVGGFTLLPIYKALKSLLPQLTAEASTPSATSGRGPDEPR